MQTERALIAVDALERLVILATDGETIADQFEEVGNSAEDCGIADQSDCPDPGLYLFEGTLKWVRSPDTWMGPGEWDLDVNGTVRKVKPEEIEVLYLMTPPEPEEEKLPTECSSKRGHFSRPGTNECYCGALIMDQGGSISLRRKTDPEGS